MVASGQPATGARAIAADAVGRRWATILTWSSREFRAITDSDLAVALDLLEQSIYAIHLLNHGIQLRTFTTAATRLAGVFIGKRGSLLLEGDAARGARPTLGSRRRHAADGEPDPAQVGSRGDRASSWASGLELLDRAGLEAEAAPLDDFRRPNDGAS
jgi:hypothetical protein